MPNNNNANLFALVDDKESPVRRIPLTAELSAELAQLFAAQQNALLDGKQAIDFTGSYNVDHGEIFTIAAYPLPPAIGQAISNPLTNSRVLNLKNETHRIKALFSGTWTVAREVVHGAGKCCERYRRIKVQLQKARLLAHAPVGRPRTRLP